MQIYAFHDVMYSETYIARFSRRLLLKQWSIVVSIVRSVRHSCARSAEDVHSQALELFSARCSAEETVADFSPRIGAPRPCDWRIIALQCRVFITHIHVRFAMGALRLSLSCSPMGHSSEFVRNVCRYPAAVSLTDVHALLKNPVTGLV